ncbi:MAG: nitroreductase family protein [Myxococcota bacterium]
MVDVDSVDQVLRTTRSVRRRIDFDRPLEPGVVEACIAAAVQAPTGLNREAWRFLVVTEPGPKQALAALYREAFDELTEETLRTLRAEHPELEIPEPRPTYRMLADRLQDFPALFLVCSLGRPEPANVARQVAFYGSVLPAAWSLMLSLRARGIGATWTTLLVAREHETARVLGIPEDVTPTVLLPAGYMRDAVLRPAERRAPREVTYWNAWGRRRGDDADG